MKIAVIIPVYGPAPYLADTLTSLLPAREYFGEVLIVDDGSKEPIRLESFDSGLRRDLPLSLFRQENRGLSGARNAAISRVRSEFILPLDADDLLVAENVKAFVEAQKKTSASLVYGDFERFGDGYAYGKCVPWEKQRLTVVNGLPYCSLYHRRVWETVGGYDESLRTGAEDWQFWIKCQAHAIKGVYVPRPILKYRVHSGSHYLAMKTKDTVAKANVVLSYPQAFPEYLVHWANIAPLVAAVEAREQKSGGWLQSVGRMPTHAQCLLDEAILEFERGNFEKAAGLLFSAIQQDQNPQMLREMDAYQEDLLRALQAPSLKASLRAAFKRTFQSA